MNTFIKLLLVLTSLIATAAVVLMIAGQMGYLKGAAPTDLGVHEGRLKAPSPTPNSVSSQAALHPGHPQAQSAQIAPFKFAGDGAAAMARLADTVAHHPRTRVVFSNGEYLRAESTTALGFADDVEFWLDGANGVIQVRSASRLGQLDLGANRKRVEALRAEFER